MGCLLHVPACLAISKHAVPHSRTSTPCTLPYAASMTHANNVPAEAEHGGTGWEPSVASRAPAPSSQQTWVSRCAGFAAPMLAKSLQEHSTSGGSPHTGGCVLCVCMLRRPGPNALGQSLQLLKSSNIGVITGVSGLHPSHHLVRTASTPDGESPCLMGCLQCFCYFWGRGCCA